MIDTGIEVVQRVEQGAVEVEDNTIYHLLFNQLPFTNLPFSHLPIYHLPFAILLFKVP